MQEYFISEATEKGIAKTQKILKDELETQDEKDD